MAAIGTLVPRPNGWWLRLPKGMNIPGKRAGSRPLVRLDPSIPVDDEHRDEARRCADRVLVELGVRPAEAKPVVGETVADWFKRWLAERVERGIGTNDNASHWRKWLAPVLAALPMASVQRVDVEKIVGALDVGIHNGSIRPKTASNVWTTCTTMFDDAKNSKRRDLRVRDDNPATDVRGPDGGQQREGPYPYPREFLAFVACERIPSRWKRLVAISIYLYVRAGELKALEWSDVDLERRVVHVHKSIDRRTKAIKETKGRRNRKVPIEPTLVPLLDAMKKADGGKGSVVRMPSDAELPVQLRKYLRWALEDAGIEVRADLFADDLTRRPLDWHDLRHAGATWRAIRGDDPIKIQRAIGHSSLGTTQRYINESETFDREVFGEVFPPLPLEQLLTVTKRVTVTTKKMNPAVFSRDVLPPSGIAPDRG